MWEYFITCIGRSASSFDDGHGHPPTAARQLLDWCSKGRGYCGMLDLQIRLEPQDGGHRVAVMAFECWWPYIPSRVVHEIRKMIYPPTRAFYIGTTAAPCVNHRTGAGGQHHIPRLMRCGGGSSEQCCAAIGQRMSPGSVERLAGHRCCPSTSTG